MAMTLRLKNPTAEALRARARQTGRSQASLLEEAVERLLQSEPNLNGLLDPPETPYREVPPEQQITGAPPMSEILDELRADRV